jgi:hypothetical protein
VSISRHLTSHIQKQGLSSRGRYDSRHPLLVEDVGPRDVRGDVSSDGVSQVLSSVRVKLSSVVTVRDVDLAKSGRANQR